MFMQRRHFLSLQLYEYQMFFLSKIFLFGFIISVLGLVSVGFILNITFKFNFKRCHTVVFFFLRLFPFQGLPQRIIVFVIRMMIWL